MEGKKISFGFMKTKKTDKPILEERREYIDCVEEKSIKVVGGVAIEEIKPLVIPLQPNTLMTAERLKAIAEKVEGAIEEPEADKTNSTEEEKLPENETLEQMAVRELMQEAKKEIKVETEALTVPVLTKPVAEGEKESTLDDYEAVPIQQFGLAMLRGMGWTPRKEQSKYKPPQLRPKGLGLGADKVVSDNQKKKSKNSKDEELTIVKNSFVKIVTGKYNGYYGKVLSLDEDNGRVMVDIPVKKETVSLSEFMMHPVTKTEYDKESKVINADTFDEYKKNEKGQMSSKKETETSSNKSNVSKNREERNYIDRRDREMSSNGRNKDRHRIDSSEERSSRRKKDKKRYSSNESLSSLSDKDRKPKKKDRKHSSSSESSDYKKSKKSDGKRDIDKKRKGKKKKRDRDRSPNYKKYRK